MFNLNYNGGDVECPHCKKSFGVTWDTEFGDPLMGEHDTLCLECGTSFTFQVSIQYHSWPTLHR